MLPIQKGFSGYFTSLHSNPNKIRTDSRAPNPFIFISNYSRPENFLINFENFQEGLYFQTQLDLSIAHSYNCFVLEINLLEENKTEYLNRNVHFLLLKFDSLNKLTKEEIKSALIINSIMEILAKICASPYQVYLSSSNRKRLSRWFKVEELITSFVLKILPEDKYFERLFKDRLSYGLEKGFISTETSFSTFKALFDGKYLENKINWIDNKASLRYFIKSLISSKLIINPKNKHWEITSEFFFLKGEIIRQSELLNQKSTIDKMKINRINQFIHELKNYS